jgi:two-component system chemotaxis response regulator CheY
MKLSRARTALVVHINQEIMGLMRAVLEAKGCEVFESKSPLDGLKLIDEHCPDIVIHNNQMPLMDGVTFDRKIRGKHGPKKPAIVWISMTPLKASHVAGCGINAWIKPFFEPTEFAYFMDEVLGGMNDEGAQSESPSPSAPDLPAH